MDARQKTSGIRDNRVKTCPNLEGGFVPNVSGLDKGGIGFVNRFHFSRGNRVLKWHGAVVLGDGLLGIITKIFPGFPFPARGISMRTLMKTLLFAVSLGLAALSPAAQKPDVILITVDDLNDWIGCMGGHPHVKTTNLDRLAARGILYTNAHCQAPVCNPSRTSFLTGLRPSTSGVYSLDASFRKNPELKDHPTIHQAFKRAGYATFSTGKIYHLLTDKQDKQAATFGIGGEMGPVRKKKLVNTPSSHPALDWGPLDITDEEMPDYKISQSAIGFLNQARTQPLFMTVGFSRPHVPLNVPQKWFDMYQPADYAVPGTLPAFTENDRDDCPRASWYLHWMLPEPRLKFLRESNTWASKVHAYLASVSFVDAQIGRLLDAVEKSPNATNTIICLLSDHGYHLGEKEISGKNSLWDVSTRVPLILAAPGISGGAKNASAVELLDIYPTLASLAGIEVKAKLDGKILPLDATLDPARTAITCQGPYNQTVRTATHRYIRYMDDSEELYDHASDRFEHKNLAQEPAQTATKETLRKLLIAEPKAPLPGANVRLSTLIEGVPYWEGKPIKPGDPIPEL
jgi:choline-sulfatase